MEDRQGDKGTAPPVVRGASSAAARAAWFDGVHPGRGGEQAAARTAAQRGNGEIR